MKILSVREVNENVSKALNEARNQPILVRHGDQAAVWMVSADEIAQLTERLTADDNLFHHVLELIAVDLFGQGTLTMGQAARLLSISVGSFLELCDRLRVPILRETDRSVSEQIDSFERWLESAKVAGES